MVNMETPMVTPSDRLALTEAQKTALLGARCTVPQSKEEWTAECVCSIGPTVFTELARMGLTYRRETWPHGYLLTDLGREVRASLENGHG